ncbi:helix-turn-helix-type transcriptional regulator, partial [Erwinia amylovora]|nr:helix-turn-helix-type transcriptional regulator [Erwinia amylovora]
SQDKGIVALQDEMMSLIRLVRPSKLRVKIASLGKEFQVDTLIDEVFVPIRQRLGLDQNTSRNLCSFLDGALIDYISFCLSGARNKAGKD